MSLTVTGTVTQSTPVSGVVTLTFTDTTTGVTGLVSRTLNIYNYNSVLVATVDMGAVLTASIGITADGYYSFVETIVDGSGTSTGQVDLTTDAFYIYAFVASVSALSTQCDDLFGQILNQSNAQNNRYAALDIGMFGNGAAAQNLITYANFLITTPYYA